MRVPSASSATQKQTRPAVSPRHRPSRERTVSGLPPRRPPCSSVQTTLRPAYCHAWHTGARGSGLGRLAAGARESPAPARIVCCLTFNRRGGLFAARVSPTIHEAHPEPGAPQAMRRASTNPSLVAPKEVIGSSGERDTCVAMRVYSWGCFSLLLSLWLRTIVCAVSWEELRYISFFLLGTNVPDWSNRRGWITMCAPLPPRRRTLGRKPLFDSA